MVPYTRHNLDQLFALTSQYMKIETIGTSVQGRDIKLLTIIDPTVANPGKKVIWLIARQHAWEAGTSWTADGAVRFLQSEDKAAMQLRRLNIFKVLPVFDPDGVADGAVRFNANGFDNNRNWDTVNPKLMPEIAATRNAVLNWLAAGKSIDLLLALHNDEDTD